MSSPLSVLVTGASGYIGSCLLDILLDSPHTVYSMVRRPKQFKKSFARKHSIRYGDTNNYKSLVTALKGIDIAFYFIHSLAEGDDFIESEKLSAINFVKAAEENNVKRIVYLGGLFDDSQKLSLHLQSRNAVGDIIRNSSILSITFRASIIIGAGSLSYELIRNLTERLPIMITPKWVRVKAQPISIKDVLRYLSDSILLPIKQKMIFEIGGSDVVSYSDIMQEYAKQRGLYRIILPVPVLSPKISSLWLSLFTPLYAKIGKKLIQSIKSNTIVKNSDKTHDYFSFKTLNISDSIKFALDQEESDFFKSHWASSYSSSNYQDNWIENTEGNKLIYIKKIIFNVPIIDSFFPIQVIGGKNGWYFANWIWYLRGIVDVFLGGPGAIRGRKHSKNLTEGDFLDWWRVVVFNPPFQLRLYAEMKLPGRAWLDFSLKKLTETQTEVYISAIFEPKGLFGRIYWYSLYPIHFFIFTGLLNKIKILAYRVSRE
ncbi:MAG: NAD(P)-dependent oxidoreductase [Actinobacteria bacterium]|nr:NAD(P)-dependent oxidoreductase [Actinomycetota bacterium]|tara:strand:+ start:2882 stop:4339 length:1458 start_codon:yes stop_codon:yes gene_type:complete